MDRPLEFHHAWDTCTETFSTLRIFSDDVPPDEITARLGVEPTDSHHKGESHNRGKLVRKHHGWFYTTERLSDSRDSGYHLELILGALEGKAEGVADLQARGCEFDVCSFWVGVGQGGPNLYASQMRRLGALGLRIWWDIYFDREELLKRALRSVAPGMPDESQREMIERVATWISDYYCEKYDASRSRDAEKPAVLPEH